MKVLKEIELNGGNICIGIDAGGRILILDGEDDNGNAIYELELTAHELDAIAHRVRMVSDFRKAWENAPCRPRGTRYEGHTIGFAPEGEDGPDEMIHEGARFGCQWVKADDVLKIHRASVLIRQRVRALRKRKASRK